MERLRRQFRVVLTCCTFREIARFNRAFFANNWIAVDVAGEYVESRNMANLPILNDLINVYRENRGEFM